MLVLSRNLGESITINENITVQVVDVRGNRVRIAVDAPNNVPIHRTEIQEKIWRERQTQTTKEGTPVSTTQG